jgi:mRNA interferase MazF
MLRATSREQNTVARESNRAVTASIKRGDVYWIGPDDARGPAPSYSHPHVVVQEDVFNDSRITTVIVCALTSNLQKANEPGNVLLDEGEGDLPQRSVVVVSQISSVEKARLGERIGGLSEPRVEQILAGLRFQQTSFFKR